MYGETQAVSRTSPLPDKGQVCFAESIVTDQVILILGQGEHTLPLEFTGGAGIETLDFCDHVFQVRANPLRAHAIADRGQQRRLLHVNPIVQPAGHGMAARAIEFAEQKPAPFVEAGGFRGKESFIRRHERMIEPFAGRDLGSFLRFGHDRPRDPGLLFGCGCQERRCQNASGGERAKRFHAR